MKIVQHRLVAEAGEKPIQHLNTPNQNNTIITPKFLIIHYTAGNDFQSSVNWLMDKKSQASAHLVIGRDGKIAQLGAFNKRLWHAGVSRWANFNDLNSHSIGIELDNCGRLKKNGNNYLNVSNRVIKPAEVMIAKHKNETTESAWHTYTQAQLDVLRDVAWIIVRHYNIVEILGHDDIAPGRKADPGPALPMESFVNSIFGRNNADDNLFKVTADGVNFRTGPEQKTDNVLGKLKKNTVVEFIRTQNGWVQVYLITPVPGIEERIGWVHNSLLKEA